MPSQQTVRLTKDTLGIVNGVRLIVVPSESLVTVLPGSNDSKLVRLLYNGQESSVFSKDLEERAVSVDRELATRS